MSIVVKNLNKSFGELQVLRDLTLEFPENKITCILGPSGAGKTTLLNILGGLLMPDSGTVLGINGKICSYIFQEPRLLPWKSVRDNFEFVLRSPYPISSERDAVINNYLRLVGLSDFGDFYPVQLSGGMKQRASIARAFAYPSNLLLMDEPFKALDLQLKQLLMRDFLQLWQKDKRTVICVTHDLEEALYLGEVVYLLTYRPAKLRTSYSLEIDHNLRQLYDPCLSNIREELLALLLESKAI